MKKLLRSLLLLSIAFSFASCNDEDDYHAANYEMEFVDMLTDNTGTANKFVRDNGEVLAVSNPLVNLRADTTYRFIAIFTKESESARISSCALAVSNLPLPDDGTSPLDSDVVSLQSIWRGSHYINMTLQVLTKEGHHIFGFVNKGITSDTLGNRVLHLWLNHRANNDIEAFSQTYYLSCPLQSFEDSLRKGVDSIYFDMNLRNKGITRYKLPY